MAAKPPARVQNPSELVKVADDAVRMVKLVWALMRDGRVKPLVKLIPILGLVYVISPVDLLPSALCGLAGALDDLTVMAIAVAVFLHLVPKQIVEEVRRRIG